MRYLLVGAPQQSVKASELNIAAHFEQTLAAAAAEVRVRRTARKPCDGAARASTRATMAHVPHAEQGHAEQGHHSPHPRHPCPHLAQALARNVHARGAAGLDVDSMNFMQNFSRRRAPPAGWRVQAAAVRESDQRAGGGRRAQSNGGARCRGGACGS